MIVEMYQCADCLAHTNMKPHDCPPWLKAIVSKKKNAYDIEEHYKPLNEKDRPSDEELAQQINEKLRDNQRLDGEVSEASQEGTQ